jgi:hypothetical protein
MQRFICGFLLLALATGAQAAGRFTLVNDGKPACAIIIAEQAGENARVGAEELQRYVEKISGAKLPIYLDSEKIVHQDPLILVGRSRYTDAIAGLKIPDGVTNNLREEGYIITATPATLVLAGNDTHPYYGTRYAVSDLLGRLGVRWFLPGEYGEVVPKAKTLAVPVMSIEEHPDFPLRAYWTHDKDAAMREERALWTIRQRLNPRGIEWFGLPGDGSLAGYLPKDQVKAHPVWFALQPDSSRNPNLPCMTDELRRADPSYAGQPRILDEVLKKMGEDALQGKRHSAMAPDDGTPACECDACKAMSLRYSVGFAADRTGNPVHDYLSGQEWFFFVDKLLEATAQKYPGHLIATNGYSNRVFPPEVPPTFNRHKNLTIMYADILGCTIHAYDDPKCWQIRDQYNMIKQWTSLSDKVWVYGYNFTMMVTKKTFTPTTRRVRRNLPLLKEAGIVGFYDSDAADMTISGIPTYLARHTLQWNVKADMDAVLADFYRKWFGPAAKPMREYHTALENAFDDAPYHAHEDVILPLIYTPKLMAQLERCIVKAEGATKTDAEKLRVHAERLGFEHLRGYVQTEQAKRELRFADAARLMEGMLALKAEMHAITPHFGWQPYAVYAEDWEAERMHRLAKKIDGTEGTLLAPLPETTRFRADPYDAGRSERWMAPGFPDAKWQLARTTTGWQNQGLKDDGGRPLLSKDGHDYRGYGWYRFTVNLPPATGGQARLFFPAAINQVWVWVNGQYAGRSNYVMAWFRPAEFDLDITPYLQPGNNDIALRVLCTEQYFGANGLYERPFIYMKKP